MDNIPELHAFLQKDLDLKDLDDLDDLSARLWLMSKQDSTSISPLHRQLVKRREIVISEDPRLHLVWHRIRIFIKPLPPYLFSQALWETHLNPVTNERLFKAACGFIRTYLYLVQYESDFRVITKPDLCPLPGCKSFEQFYNFSSGFASILDTDTSPRYALESLGSLGLICTRSIEYHEIMWKGSEQAAAVMMVLVLVLVAWIGMLFLHRIIREWIYAVKDHRRLSKKLGGDEGRDI